MSAPYALRSLYRKEAVNIKQIPSISKQYAARAGSQITIGDLHGNALKLMYFLVKHGVLTNVSDNDYRRFVALYDKNPNELNKNDLIWFNQFLGKLNVNALGTLRFIGDELADRGSNDYFTLKIFELLSKKKVKMEVILSNHGADFIQAHEINQGYRPQVLGYEFAASMAHLNHLINKGLVSKNEIDNLVKQHYLPNLKALSYTFDETTNRIAIFSHAPIGLETIRALANRIGVEYNDNTMKDLAATIEEINRVFNEEYVKRGRIHTLLDNHAVSGSGANIDSQAHPFAFLLWNRNYNRLERPSNHKGYHLKYIHGHDNYEQNVTGRIYNLDNHLGKGMGGSIGEYEVHYTQETQLNKAEIKKSQRNYTQQKDNKGWSITRHPALTAIALGLAAALGAYYFALPVMLVGLAVSAVAFTGLQIRQALFEHKLAGLSTTTQQQSNAFQCGQQAANSWGDYAKSYGDFSAWKNYRTFGAGLCQGLNPTAAHEKPKQRVQR